MKEIPIRGKLVELDIAIRASVDAGKKILEIYQNDFETYTKEDNSPITEADLQSNEILKKILSETGHHILSEEDKDNKSRLDKRTLWIIDPLDGTSDFIDKTGEFTIMVALIKDKKPVLGIINWPTENTLFAAQIGKGAYKYSNENWIKIQVSNTDELGNCKIIGSRHHLSEKERLFIKNLGIKEFTSIGSSLKVGKISSGEAEAYITTTNKMKEWDTAASYCIIKEAGGKMTDISGNEITYNNKDVYHNNGIVVSNGLIHERIIAKTKKLK